MEIDETENEYSIKGGRTILGRIFSYQEKTGMSPKQILELPYIQFVISMLDAPSIDYNKKKDKKVNNEELTAGDQVAAVIAALS